MSMQLPRAACHQRKRCSRKQLRGCRLVRQDKIPISTLQQSIKQSINHNDSDNDNDDGDDHDDDDDDDDGDNDDDDDDSEDEDSDGDDVISKYM